MAKPREGVLFIGGDGPAADLVRPYLEGAEMVVAADSGYDLACAAECEPDLLVGDMDSIADLAGAQRLLEGGRIITFQREKDETDTEIGLRLLYEHGIDAVTLIGGGGGRLDHLIGILALFERPRPPQRWLTARELVVHIAESACFDGMRGVVCSLFPVGDDVVTMSSTGLRWPLDGLEWRRGDVGISNYGMDDRVTITMSSGRAILVRNLDERANV